MKASSIFKNLAVLSAFFIVSAQAQNAGTVTQHAFAIGKGAGVSGYTSLLCGSAQLAVGQAAADPICQTITGDASLSAAGAITLGTVNANVGSFGSATNCPAFTVNAKGLITAASATTCTPAVGSVTGLGSGIATFLATPSSANLRAAMTDETGTGLAYFQGGALGTPASGTLTNATGLPIAGISGLGGGVATALGVGVNGSGGLVTFSGVLGTPSSGTLTNATGLPANGGLTGQVPIANGGTGQATAPAARASSGLNVDSFTGHGDSAYTILATDRTVGTNAAFTASRTWTLPAANAVNPGQEIIVSDFQGTVTGTNTLVISHAGTDTVNGGTSVTISAANGAYLLKSDGASKWTAQALGAAAAGGVSSVTCGTGLSGGTITTSGTCALALNSAVLSAQPANPTGTASSTPLMMGLGSTCKITPTYSTRVEVEIFGDTTNTASGASNGIRMSWGTGTAPANAAAAAGTAIGSVLLPTIPGAAFNVFFKNGGVITGLTVGTQIWFDLQINVGAGTGSVAALTCNAKEVL